MKKLYCTVVTDFDGVMESPTIYHIKAETVEQVQAYVIEELTELGYDTEEEVLDTFDLFTFEVRTQDIVEL